MKELSADRQNCLTRLIVDDLLKNQSVSTDSSTDLVFQAVKKGVSLFVREWGEIDQAAQKKISSIKRNIIPGSSEWEVLYNQYIEELFQKKSILFVKDN